MAGLRRARRFIAVLVASIVATVLVAVTGAPPAAANISGALPANGFGEITYDFTTEDALFAYVVTDIKGGRVCVVDASDDFDSGSCAAPAFGEANQVVGIGTVYTLLEGPQLDTGDYMLRWEKMDPSQQWVFGGTGEVFHVGPCVDDCVVGVGRQQAEEFKRASGNVREFNKQACAAFAGKEIIGTRGTNLGSLPSNISTASQGWTGAVVGGAALTFLDVSPGADAALRILKDLTCAVGKMYDDIAQDPPDPDYGEVATAAPVPVADLGSPALNELATALARNHAFALAALHSYERYQGAVDDDALAGQRRQAQATAENVHGMVDELRASASALRTWADDAETDADLGGAVFATSAARNQLVALYQRVATSGLSAPEMSDLTDMGYSPAEIAQVRSHFGIDLSVVPVGADLATVARTVADGLEDQIAGIDAFARHMGAIAATNLADPIASFDATQSASPPNKYTFTSTSQSPDGDPLELRWTFGDGATATGATVNHTYGAGGTFTVTLTADDGFTTSTATQQVVVAPLDGAPQPHDDLATVLVGGTVTFDVLANDLDPEGGELTVVDWTPAEGGTFECDAGGTCTYEAGPDPGREQLLYSVSDGTTTSTGVVKLTITYDAPPAVGDVTLSLPSNASVVIDVNVVDIDTPADQVSLAVQSPPTHGTGSFNGRTLTYVPNTGYDGADELTYRAFDGVSWSAPGTASITVLPTNAPPTATSGTATAESGVPTDIPLDGADPDGNTVAFVVELTPDHGSVTIAGATATYTASRGYAGPDSFTFHTSDGVTTSDPATMSIDVVAPAGSPIVDLGPDRVVDEGLVTLDANGVFDPDGSIVSSLVDWGDGSTDTTTYAHTYDDGTYTATVTVTDDDGNTSSDSIELTVRPVAPGVPSIATSIPLLPGLAISFAAGATDPAGDPLTYAWDLGDGVTSTDEGPVHTYDTGGSRTVRVTLTDDDGLASTGFAEIFVEPLVADLGPDLELPEGSIVTFTPTASPAPGAVTWTWDLGDGTTLTSNDTTLSHTYADDAPRTVTLTVSTGGASTSDSVDVAFTNEAPVVAPAVPVGLDPGASGTFLAGAVDPGADDLTIEWDFGDGTTGSGPRLQHAYGAEGDYEVHVTVTDDDGAATEAVAGVVEVEPQPARPFTSRGRSFSIAFSPNIEATPTTLSLLISGEQDATGYVAIPGLGFRREFAIEAGHVRTFVLPTDAMRGAGISENAVLVRARQEISVYGVNREAFTTDAFMAIPDDVAGTHSRAMTYQPTSELAVVAVEPDTHVTVGTGDPVELQPGQVWRTPGGGDAPNDLAGVTIDSDRPVQVYSGNLCVPVQAPFCDHLAEAIPPADAWGQRFLTVPLATRKNGDTYRIVADRDGTVVSIDGSAVATLDAGQVHEQLIDGPSEITATAPVLVAQFSNGTVFDDVVGDPFMMLVPPFEQWLTSYATATVDDIGANFLNIVVRDDGADDVTVDGTAVLDWTPIGSTGYVGAQVSVEPGDHRLEGTRPFSVNAYGFGAFDSYGYPAGMAIAPVASAAELTATPATGDVAVGDESCVVAHVERDDDTPVGGMRVDVERSGANPGFGSVFTDAGGDAEYCYAGSHAGDDDLALSAASLTASAERTWQAPLPPAAAPVVSAGPDRSVVEGGHITLSASATDPDDLELSYSWTPATGLDDATKLQPTFSAVDDVERTYTFGACNVDTCATDTVGVTVLNAPPVLALDAPVDDAAIGATVTVAGSFTDPGALDHHTATIDWGDGGDDEAVDASGGHVSGQHAYSHAGTFGITVCVLDDDAGLDCASDTVVIGGGSGGGGGGGGGGGTPDPAPPQDQPDDGDADLPLERIAGVDRSATSIAISRDLHPTSGSAGAVVLATSGTFVDALAGSPLAVALDGPLLLTPAQHLDRRVADEIRRVLAPTGEVILLGGTAALAPEIADEVGALGYRVTRLAGPTRFSTAVAIARRLPDATSVLLVDGWHFPDALVAGAAAAQLDAIVLLTDGDEPSPETVGHLDDRALAKEALIAVGGPATHAHPNARAVAGRDRYETAVLVAAELLGPEDGVGFASGAVFADALPGGVHAGTLGWSLLLLPPSGRLPDSLAAHLHGLGTGATRFVVYGGTAAVDDGVLAEVRYAMTR